MAGSTTQGPMRVNTLINNLKLLPGCMRIQVSNTDGNFYISDFIIQENCTVELVLTPIPDNDTYTCNCDNCNK